jgi:peptidyl-prolyl cis-trans isomerase C
MRTSLALFLCLFSLHSLWAANALSAEPSVDAQLLAKRGKGVVTQDAFAARAERIPAVDRREALRNTNRVRDLLNTMLLRAQLAADAREAGFDQDPMVRERMKLGAEQELVEAWVQHYVDSQPAGDYEQLAREYYALNKDQLMHPERIDVTHILISIAERDEIEAKALVESLKTQVDDDPSLFDQLVLEHSEDPSAPTNKGKFKMVKRGDMVKPFETAAFAMEPGQISEPVRTRYGFHLIRLDAFIEPQHMSFDEIKPQLIEAERQEHEDRIKRDYLGSLTSIDVEMTEEALVEMVRRQFGDDYPEEPQATSEKE